MLDFRYEFYQKPGEIISAALFYKYFKNPIEVQLNTSGVNTFAREFVNAPSAYSYGLELEFRKALKNIFGSQSFVKNFILAGNFTYIYNRVNLSNITANSILKNRPMQGQSPYLINFSLQYNHTKSNTNATLLFNQIGRRIFLVGNEFAQLPNIFEAPRPILDFQIAHNIIKNGELKLGIKDIFNSTGIYYQDINQNKKYNKNTDNLSIKYKYGTNFSLSFNWKF
jgi:outer membrane receptor protein involved in Fe transport